MPTSPLAFGAQVEDNYSRAYAVERADKRLKPLAQAQNRLVLRKSYIYKSVQFITGETRPECIPINVKIKKFSKSQIRQVSVIPRLNIAVKIVIC